MLWRQLFQGLPHLLTEFAARRGAEGIALCRGYAVQLLFSLFTMRDRMPAFPPAPVNREIGRDPVKPGRETGAPFKAAQILIRADESLLGQLNRVVGIMDQS